MPVTGASRAGCCTPSARISDPVERGFPRSNRRSTRRAGLAPLKTPREKQRGKPRSTKAFAPFRAFRAFQADEQGNPALRPELATGVDLAYEVQGKDGVQWNVGGYARRIRDVVLTDTTLRDGRWVATPRNGGSARSWGIEMDAKAPLDALIAHAPDITLRANATYNASRVDDVPEPDNRLDGQLRFTGSVGADYRIDPRWSTGASYTWRSGDATRVSTWQTDLEGWNRELDLYVLRAFGPRNKLRLSVGNLLHPDTRSGQRLQDENGTQLLQRERRISPTWRLQWELSL